MKRYQDFVTQFFVDFSCNCFLWNAHVNATNSHVFLGRAAVEYEKNVHAENMEQSQAMEKNMISMAREVEKLRAELANAEKRALAAAAAAAAANPGNSASILAL